MNNNIRNVFNEITKLYICNGGDPVPVRLSKIRGLLAAEFPSDTDPKVLALRSCIMRIISSNNNGEDKIDLILQQVKLYYDFLLIQTQGSADILNLSPAT